MDNCPTCGTPWRNVIPPEPPIGSVITDKYGLLYRRFGVGWGEPYISTWESMWKGRGPLTLVNGPKTYLGSFDGVDPREVNDETTRS